jgi:hypothetical protein
VAYHEFDVATIKAMRDRVQRLASDFDEILDLIKEQGEDGIYAQLSSFDVYLPRLEEQITKAVFSASSLGVKHTPHRVSRPIEPAPSMGGVRPAKKTAKKTSKKPPQKKKR